MKPWLRIIAFSLTLLALGGLLCGCETLDNLRTDHGFYEEDGSITLGGIRYRPLIYTGKYAPDFSRADTVHITEYDVPVLVKDIFGDTFYQSLDGVYLARKDSNEFYCREAEYETASKMMEYGYGPGGFMYRYEFHDSATGNSFSNYYCLDDWQASHFTYLDLERSAIRLEEYPDYDYRVTLETGLYNFSRYGQSVDFCCIQKEGTDYEYFVVEYEAESEKYLYYPIYNHYTGDYAKIMEQYITDKDTWDTQYKNR